MSFDNMYQHANQHFEFKIIDDMNQTQTRGIVLNLKMTDGRFKISVPQSIPSTLSGYRVDFWADENGNGVYDFDHALENTLQSTQLDHSWRVFLDDTAPRDEFTKVTHVDQSYLLAFRHHLGDFVDLNEFPDRGPVKPPLDIVFGGATINIKNIDKVPPGTMAQIRVATPTGHIVGLYRFRTFSLAPVPPATFSLASFFIPNCIDGGDVYVVDLYIDANGNNDGNGNGYDDPSAGPGNDLGWRTPLSPAGPGTAGLTVTFDATDTAGGNVNVGAP